MIRATKCGDDAEGAPMIKPKASIRNRIAATRERLVEAFPACFAPAGAVKTPLQIGIHRDIRRRMAGLQSADVWLAIEDYVSGETYLGHMVEGAVRIDLDGRPAGVVTAEEAVVAAARLAEVREAKARRLRMAAKAPAARRSPTLTAAVATIAAREDAVRRPSEERRATHDGYIWPFGRAVMTDRRAIVARMVEDVTAVRRAGDADTERLLPALFGLGWSIDQLRRHLSVALAAMAAEAAEAEPAEVAP